MEPGIFQVNLVPVLIWFIFRYFPPFSIKSQNLKDIFSQAAYWLAFHVYFSEIASFMTLFVFIYFLNLDKSVMPHIGTLNVRFGPHFYPFVEAGQKNLKNK